MKVNLADEKATVDAGAEFAKALVASTHQQAPQTGSTLLVFLNGELGAGKTTFCRGVLNALGHSGAVKSPTYTLVEPYEHLQLPVYHFDLYRLSDPEELEFMGIRDYLSAKCLCLVEWPERGREILRDADLQLNFVIEGPGRTLHLDSQSERGRMLLSMMQKS